MAAWSMFEFELWRVGFYSTSANTAPKSHQPVSQTRRQLISPTWHWMVLIWSRLKPLSVHQNEDYASLIWRNSPRYLVFSFEPSLPMVPQCFSWAPADTMEPSFTMDLQRPAHQLQLPHIPHRYSHLHQPTCLSLQQTWLNSLFTVTGYCYRLLLQAGVDSPSIHRAWN